MRRAWAPTIVAATAAAVALLTAAACADAPPAPAPPRAMAPAVEAASRARETDPRGDTPPDVGAASPAPPALDTSAAADLPGAASAAPPAADVGPAAPAAVIRPDGVSLLGWPFRTPTWYDSPGSRAHTCSDRYAKDLNTTLGSRGNTELRLGAGADVRAPIAGVVRFAGESRHNPGLGYRVVLESADVPGFFVFLAHLQPFDRAALEGRTVAQGEVLPVRVGRSGGVRHAHLHLVAYRNVLSGAARERVLRGQSLAGYACGDDGPYAAPFELRPE